MRAHPGSPRGLVLAAALLALGVGPARRGLAANPDATAPAPAVTPLDDQSWRGADGRIRSLYRPRFVPASDLLVDARAFGIGGVDLSLDPVRGRLLVTGQDPAILGAREALAFLDVPRPQVLVRVGVVETARRARRQTGGHVLFDRDVPAGAPDTLFRGLRFDFEPEDWLRSEVVGGRPFEGASVSAGQGKASGGLAGTLDAVLRALAHTGEASFLAEPTLVCQEGVMASLESTVALPATVFSRVNLNVTNQTVAEKAGLRLEVTAERVGRDHVTLHLHPWVRAVVMAAADGGPDSYPVLAVREVDTRLSLSDGDTVLVGGLETLSRSREREGLPLGPCPTALDGLLSATAREGEATEILFLVHVAILTPGRDPGGMLPPFEAERLLHRPSRARVVPAPLPAPERR